MKTIEERGGDFATNYEVLADDGHQKNEYEIARESYITGAKCEHSLLTRWNDPQKELPPIYENVMIKYKASDGCVHITIAWRSAGDAGGYTYAISGTGVTINSQNILGWRMIHQ